MIKIYFVNNQIKTEQRYITRIPIDYYTDRVYVIHAEDGRDKNNKYISSIKETDKKYINNLILTNDINLLDNELSWDEIKNKPGTFIWNENNSEFYNVCQLLDEEINKNDNIKEMFLSGKFNKQ